MSTPGNPPPADKVELSTGLAQGEIGASHTPSPMNVTAGTMPIAITTLPVPPLVGATEPASTHVEPITPVTDAHAIARPSTMGAVVIPFFSREHSTAARDRQAPSTSRTPARVQRHELPMWRRHARLTRPRPRLGRTAQPRGRRSSARRSTDRVQRDRHPGPSIGGPAIADHDQVVDHGRFSATATTVPTAVVAAIQADVRGGPRAMSDAGAQYNSNAPSHNTTVTETKLAVSPSTSNESAMYRRRTASPCRRRSRRSGPHQLYPGRQCRCRPSTRTNTPSMETRAAPGQHRPPARPENSRHEQCHDVDDHHHDPGNGSPGRPRPTAASRQPHDEQPDDAEHHGQAHLEQRQAARRRRAPATRTEPAT